MAKLERLGCSKTLVGLVVPTGYTFNADGTSLYMTLAALFVAQATNTHLTLLQQFTILGVALLSTALPAQKTDVLPPTVFALRDARVVVSAGEVLPKATVVIRDGVIDAVGPEAIVPSDALVTL